MLGVFFVCFSFCFFFFFYQSALNAGFLNFVSSVVALGDCHFGIPITHGTGREALLLQRALDPETALGCDPVSGYWLGSPAQTTSFSESCCYIYKVQNLQNSKDQP